ncbi:MULTISPECIES: hypothetical protein [unclassified Stenotrophomonas]|uniref:hypothetical protein n=1 Tax=unclassified Stenotrophomonas TaxID=196198 RepID=UPI000D1786FD|nr:MULTISPECIES: hypothetical protein [unclassified Stenotrophomonas]PTA72712.1 hypothetical protein C9412_04440 [Stenotrophomonas sp. Nf1]PTA82463.1 hypothetical protein C9416_04620 [Stenotrophomonas sp. Nf4]
MKWICMLALLAVSASVSAGIENIKPTAKVGADEGILVATTACAGWARFVQLYRPGTPSTGALGLYRFSSVTTCEPGIKTRRVKAGRYYIGWIAVGQTGLAVPEAEAYSFTIEPGKLNYIGQIRVGMHPELELERHPRSGTPADMIQVTDREAEARATIAAEYPWLLEKFPFVRALAVAADKEVETDNGAAIPQEAKTTP